MKICNQCGMRLNNNAVYCNCCGSQFLTYVPDQNNQQGNYQNNQQGYYPNGQQAYYQAPASKPQKTGPSGLSIAAFILSFIIAPLGLILGIVDLAKKSGRKKGLSIAAVILSAVGSLFMILMIASMAPQLSKYIEKTNVAADMQTCDMVRTAIATALYDPGVVANDSDMIRYFSDQSWHDITELGSGAGYNTLSGAVTEIMGCDMYQIESQLKSNYKGRKASGMQFRISEGNYVEVRILNSDRSGKKGSQGGDPIMVP